VTRATDATASTNHRLIGRLTSLAPPSDRLTHYSQSVCLSVSLSPLLFLFLLHQLTDDDNVAT